MKFNTLKLRSEVMATPKLYQLANEISVYGAYAGSWMVVSDDISDELAGPFKRREDAEKWIVAHPDGGETTEELVSEVLGSFRWNAHVTYKDGGEPVALGFDELHELHDLIERGPDWNTIDKITVTLRSE